MTAAPLPVYDLMGVEGRCPEMHGDVDRALAPNPERPCTRCGKPIGRRRYRWCSDECARWFSKNHSWTDARVTALRAAHDAERNRYVCAFCGKTGAEVDHIEAAEGRHGKKSCIHHQSNLRVLCIPCHRDRTREQARERADRRAGRQRLAI